MHIAGSYYGLLAGGTFLLVIGGAVWRTFQKRDSGIDSWKAVAAVAFLFFFLLGRALFYGLVEAAVVPDVNRYMDCASPFASVLLVLLVALPLLIIHDLLRRYLLPEERKPSTATQ